MTIKASTRRRSRAGGCEEQGLEVGVGGCPDPVGSTSPNTLSRENTKRVFLPSEKILQEVEAKRFHEACFTEAQKQKSDICRCAILSPQHTVGYHEAVVEGGGL